ncbi:MAG: hypothetical protein ACQEQM_01540 [Thermoplasmatota archaeon]
MRSTKKAGLVTVIIALTVITLILTYTFLPAYLKERGDIYTAWEKGQWHLTSDDYDELLIEYDYIQNFAPNYTAINTFDSVLREYTDKEEITHKMGDVISYQDTKPVYTEQDLVYLEERYRREETKDNTLVIYVLYLNGEWEKEGVLGLSYRGSNIVIFKEMIMSSAAKSTNLEYGSIEASVLVHEWGHLIGLVGRGYDSEHEDHEYPHHCSEEAGRCVMDSSVEIRVNGRTEEPPTSFCELCQGDIETIRNMNDPWGPAEILTYIAMGGVSLIGLTWVVSVGKDKEEEWDEESYQYDPYSTDTNYKKDDEKKYY